MPEETFCSEKHWAPSWSQWRQQLSMTQQSQNHRDAMSCPLPHKVPQRAPYTSEGFAFLSKKSTSQSSPWSLVHRHSNPAGVGQDRTAPMGSAQNTPEWLHRALGQRNTWLHLPEGCLLMLTVPIQLQSRIISPPAPERFLCPDFLRHFPNNHSVVGTWLGLLSISARTSFLSEQFSKLKPLPQVSKGKFLGSKQPEEHKE